MTAELDHLALATGLLGGLALFLFGMDIMTRALKQVAGSSMKSILARMTANRFTGLAAGALITATIQSSSVTTVLLVGFISAGLMSTAQSVAVIFGANIGTTITAQILSFNVSALALPILTLGFFVSFTARRKVVREYGRVFLGIGMVFFGMGVMSEAMAPLRSFDPFLRFMVSLDNVALAALIGAGFTALVQSSSATTGILIVMAGQGLLTLEAAVALALGANIGTCVTALLSAIGKPREAVRAAVVHTAFNIFGVAVWIGLTDQLAALARMIEPDGGVPRQLADVHTFFNVINAFLFIGFTEKFTRLAEWLVPDREEVIAPEHAPRHLDPKLLSVPAVALDATQLEIHRLGSKVRAMLEAALPAVTRGRPVDLDRLYVMDRPVDLLHRAIVGYLREISLGSLPEDQTRRLMSLTRIANDLEHIGDLIATGLVTTARKRIDEGVEISDETLAAIADLHAGVLVALDGVLTALAKQDGIAARDVRAMKSALSHKIEDLTAHGAGRLRAQAPKRLLTYAREMEITETLDDIIKIIRRIARSEIAIFGLQED